MPQKESMTAPEGNGPIPQYAIPGGITLKDFRRALSEIRGEILGEFKEDLRSMDQRLASLQRDARQSRPAMEADVQVDTKTRERTEGAAKAVQAMNGDSFSAKRIQDGPKSSTIFGEKVEPPALPCRDDVVVQNGAAAPKSCLSPLKMRTPTAAGGLLPPGETSTTTRTTFDHSTLWFCQTEETILNTSILSASHDNSFWTNLFAVPSCRRVIKTKSGQNRVFDPGGSRGRLRACPFLGTSRTSLCGEVMR